MFAQQDQIPQSPLASTTTVVVHGLLGVVVWTMSMSASVAELPASRERLTHVIMLAPPELVVVAPAPVEPTPAPTPTPLRLEPPKVTESPEMTPLPPVAERVEEMPPPPPRRAEPPPPPAPTIVVGAFAEDPRTSERRSSAPAVQAAGFDTRQTPAVVSRAKPSAVGSFEAPSAPRGPAPRPVATGSTGFGIDQVRAPQRSVAQATADPGFGSGPAAAPRRSGPTTTTATSFESTASMTRGPAARPPEVATAGFAESADARPKARVTAPSPVNRSVEVTYKPQPQYTDEARQLRIEGEVVLEVEFTADGLIRVLRVARGLGHGLDEMASRAVQQIRFNPALRNGVPVTSRADVNIVFRLT